MDKVVEIRLKLPSSLTNIVSPRSLEEEARLLIALELYREGRISLGRAAEIAGLGVRDFMYELRARKIPLNYDIEELRQDLEAVDTLAKE